MKTEKSNVEKFYEWMQRINSIHLANTPAMARGIQIVATHKIIKYEGRHKMPNFKLMSVAKEVGISIDESKLHDANYDILITRAVYNTVTGIDFEL